MSAQHHGDEKFKDQFLREMMGMQARAYPHGRMGADDDGAMTYAIAADPKRGVIRIAFPKPTAWIGLDRASAEQLRDALTEKILELRGIKADN